MLTGNIPKLMKFAMILPNALRKMPFDLSGLAHITANAVAIVLAIMFRRDVGKHSDTIWREGNLRRNRT